jgi:hypothetical protein
MNLKTRYSRPYDAKKKGISRTRVAAGTSHRLLPSGGPIHAELKKKKTTFARGLFQFWIAGLRSTSPIVPNSRASIIAHANGTPTIVETAFDTALDFIAVHVVNPNHFLHKSPSIMTIGTNSNTIAGNVKKIIGTPASASRG